MEEHPSGATKAAAIALMVQGSYVCVQDMKACNIYASACSMKLQLIGQPHGGYYDEDRVWHPRASPPSQVTYGLGVGATTIVDAGEAGATELAGAVSPGREGDAGPFTGDALQERSRRAVAHSSRPEEPQDLALVVRDIRLPWLLRTLRCIPLLRYWLRRCFASGLSMR